MVAAKFNAIFNSDEIHKSRIRSRYKAERSIGQKKGYPLAKLWSWDQELFHEAIHQISTNLNQYLWSEGEWSDDIEFDLAELLLPSMEIPVRHVFSRRVRPSWPLPSDLTTGFGSVVSVPDGDLKGWIRLAYIETFLDNKEVRFNDVTQTTQVLAGIVFEKDIPDSVPSGLPFTHPHPSGWLVSFAKTQDLSQFQGPVASLGLVEQRFDRQKILGLSPLLQASLSLIPRQEVGPLDLFDDRGKLAVAYRWWRFRPLGGHGFVEETPRLKGGMLLMRPDLFSEITERVKLQSLECVSVNNISYT